MMTDFCAGGIFCLDTVSDIIRIQPLKVKSCGSLKKTFLDLYKVHRNKVIYSIVFFFCLQVMSTVHSFSENEIKKKTLHSSLDF